MTLEKAKEACNGAGEDIPYHFADVSKMVDLAKGAQRSVQTRRAELIEQCLLDYERVQADFYG